MDKVIIDGVDISECSYAITPKRQCPNKPMPYAKETSCIGCKEHNTKLNFCKNNPNCYYKQLKRLQAENEHYRKEAYRLADRLNKTENLAFIYKQALQEIRDIVDKAYYTEDYMLGQRFTELVDAINLTITNIGAE